MIAPVSSWVGVEIGYVAAVLQDLKLDWDPFMTCLSSLQYRFFPILFIGFIFIVIICEKDLGPMLRYEEAAAASSPVASSEECGNNDIKFVTIARHIYNRLKLFCYSQVPQSRHLALAQWSQTPKNHFDGSMQ